MADYNEQDIDRMRQDALRRMREMRRRVDPPPPPEEPHRPQQSPPRNNAGGLIASLLRGTESEGLFNIAGIAIDEEKALIAMLIYILYKQGADVKLLLALGYLLL